MQETVSRKRRGSIHLGRYGEILSVLVRYGFGDILSTLNLDRYGLGRSGIAGHRKGLAMARRLSRWERVRRALEDLGPTFVKLGQFLSNRPDLLPADLIAELEKLQDATRPIAVDEVTGILEQEFKMPVSEVLTEFEQTPIASASIAQVHKARLKSGEEVAVKIQRPRLRHTIDIDIDILYHLAGLLERYYENARALHISQLVEEFERIMLKELDFSIEAAHMEVFRKNFGENSGVCVPRLFNELTGRKVLVTELVHGIKVSNVEKLRSVGINTKEIARRGAITILKQIFDHGFFHADPHPGNILIKDDGTICFLDCGAAGTIPPSLRYHIGVILYGVVSKDSERIVRTLMRLSRKPVQSVSQLEYDVAEFIQQYSALALKDIRVGEILQRFARLIIAHNLEIIPGFYLLLKSLVSLEGVGYRLDPDFNMVEHIEPHVRKLVRENPRLKYLPYDLYFAAMDLASLARDLPFDIKDLFRIVKAGETRIQFEHRGLEPLMRNLDLQVNRLVFAIVLAALIVGSSLVIHANTPPHLFGISAVGIVGFGIAALVGFGLVFSILRHRRL